MSYTTNMPQGSQKINVTTQLIRDNFNELNSRLQNDHVSINDATAGNRLTHKHVTLNVGSVPTTSANQVGWYAKNVNSIPQLFFRRASNGSEIAYSTGNLTPNLASNGGYTFLPGGLVDMWGFMTIANAPVALPNPGAATISAIYSVQLTARTITNTIQYGLSSIGAGNSFTPFALTISTAAPTSLSVWYRAVVAI